MMWSDLLMIGGCIFAYMTVIFAVAWRLKRIDIVDSAWGGAFVVIALTSLFMGIGGAVQYFVTALVVIWAVRLSGAIFMRFRRSKVEDPRYTVMRATWKTHPAVQAYMRIFLVQGVLAILVSSSVIVINLSEVTVVSSVAILGGAVWLIGFLFEAIGDVQLKRHLADPLLKDTLMTSGLWRFTRHPNYFGEAVQWWGIFIIALSIPYGWFTIIAPLTITGLLLFVSGVPLTEKRFEGRPGWGEYKKHTSVFLPLPPK